MLRIEDTHKVGVRIKNEDRKFFLTFSQFCETLNCHVVARGDLCLMNILRIDDLSDLTGLSRATIWRMERAGEFPKRIQLSRGTVGWIEDEIRDWIASRPRCSSSELGS